MSILWGARMDGEAYGLGDAPWNKETWDKFESQAGKKVSIVHFGQPAPWLAGFQAGPLDMCYARGACPLVSMDIGTATLAEVAAGKYDAAFTTWAKAAAAYKKTFMLRWCWEMNGTWYKYGKEAQADPSVYVKAWKRLYTICKNVGATNVKWVWCPNVVFYNSTPLAPLYPGNAFVDWLGMDGYNFGDKQNARQVFSTTYTQLKNLSYLQKPIIICETGCVESAIKPAWITDLLMSMAPAYSKLKALVWFNWNITENGVKRTWQIDTSPAAQKAFKDGISISHYRTNDFTGTL